MAITTSEKGFPAWPVIWQLFVECSFLKLEIISQTQQSQASSEEYSSTVLKE